MSHCYDDRRTNVPLLADVNSRAAIVNNVAPIGRRPNNLLPNGVKELSGNKRLKYSFYYLITKKRIAEPGRQK